MRSQRKQLRMRNANLTTEENIVTILASVACLLSTKEAFPSLSFIRFCHNIRIYIWGVTLFFLLQSSQFPEKLKCCTTTVKCLPTYSLLRFARDLK